MAKKNSSAAPPPHVLIRASAGTGKTFQLSNRYIGLLNSNAGSDGILASTFTRKAASEILERVILRMAHAALDDNKCSQLSAFVAQSPLTRQRFLELTQSLTRQLHRVRISTFDSFFGQVARSFSLELGFPPGWELVDSFEDEAIRNVAIGRVLALHETRDFITLMNLMTKGEAVRSVGQMLQGTVTDLYELFQETHAEAWHSIPRTKPLSQEQVDALLADLREVALPNKQFTTARDKDVESAASGDWESFIDRGLANKVLLGEYEYYRKPIPSEVVSIYNSLLKHAKGVLVGRVAMQTEATYQLLLKFHLEYQRLKKEKGAMRFDDVTRRVAALADSLAGEAGNAAASTATGGAVRSGARDPLAYRLDGRVQHLLLDEFQDTSPTQWRAIRPVALRSVEPERQGSFFCVGDVKQAIYGWRGGVAEIFDAITDELKGVDTQSLSKSFRSSPVIIETVNRIFTAIHQHPNLEQTEKAVRNWQQRFSAHSTDKAELPGYACLLTGPASDDDAEDDDSFTDFVAQRIADQVERAPGWSVGVLVRKNETVGRLIHALRLRNVHASEEGGNPLTDSAAVLLVLSLFRLADHPGDTVAQFHVVNSPIAPALKCKNLDENSAPAFAQTLRCSLTEKGYGPLIYEWTKLLVPHCNRRELSRLMQLVELGYSYQSQATLRTDDFIAFVEQQRVADPTAADVRVMTVHQAKGLEFDVVVLPELDFNLIGQPESFVVHRESPTSPVSRVCRYVNQNIQQLLPVPVQKMFETSKDRTVAEALCVLYVALTRAVHAMHMIIRPPKETERKLPRTYAGLLRAALVGNAVIAPETKAFELGDPKWYHHCKSGKVTTRKEDVKKTKPETPVIQKVTLAPITDRRLRGLERVAPSGLEGGARVRLRDLFDIQNSVALVRGTLIHAWFEQVGWMDDGAPEDESLEQVARERVPDLDTHALKMDELLRQFRAMLAKREIAAALGRKCYESLSTLGFDSKTAKALSGRTLRAECHREYNFAARDGDQLLNGSIDRLVLLYDGETLAAADILDFKTDTIPDGDPQALEAKIQFYRPQLQAYRGAIEKMTGLPLERILARLLFVSPGMVKVIQ